MNIVGVFTFVDVADRRALPQHVHQPVLMRKRAELHGQIVVVVRHVVEADEIRDAGRGDRRLEPIVCVMSQFGQLAAVAAALDAEPVAIDPRILRERGIDAGKHVLRLAAVLIAEDRVRELLAVSGRAAVVDHQRRPALRRVDLRLAVEGRPLLPVRAAVDHHDHRMARAGVDHGGHVRKASISIPSKLLNVNDSTGARRALRKQIRVERQSMARRRSSFAASLMTSSDGPRAIRKGIGDRCRRGAVTTRRRFLHRRVTTAGSPPSTAGDEARYSPASCTVK